MAISLPDARQLSDDALEAIRLRALRGCELGYTEVELGELLGVAPETISRWWTAYAAGGLAGLPGDRTGRPVGTGRVLSDDRAAAVRAVLDGTSPADCGIASPVWNRRAVRDLIRQTYDIDLATRTVGEYLRRWGYSPKVPTRHSRDQDPDEVAEWLAETYPAIAARAAAEGATIFWCDETGARADACPDRGYARVGNPATLEVPGPHIGMNLISAISPTGAVRFVTYPGSMTGGRFVEFLERFLAATTGKVFLIVDQLAAHGTAAVRAWVAAHADRLEIVNLPTHGPELNPVEYLNNDLKHEIHATGLPDTKAELREHIQTFMRKLLHWPGRIISYFQHPKVQYAGA
jgi:transposase